jgi:multidrug efflux system outer membrane protein
LYTVQDLSDSVATSLKRYRGGIATYLEVLDNQRSLFNAQLTLALDRGNEFGDEKIGEVVAIDQAN